MKILLVNNDRRWGGGQEHLKDLAGQLSLQGCSPHFFCRSDSPSARIFATLGYPVYAFGRDLAGLLKATLMAAVIFRRERFDIVLVAREHDLTGTALAWKLAFPFGTKGKLVACFHTATSRRQLCLGFADAVACVSAHVQKSLLAGNRLAPDRITILHNGIHCAEEIPPAKSDPERERRFFKGVGFPIIGMVGTFFKNQAELIEVAALIRKEFPELKVAFVGDDSDAGLTGPIIEKTQALGLAANVVFTGEIPHERLQEIYFDLDLAVSTFRNEGFGLVHLESLAAGTAVVCYNEGGQLDIFAGNNAGTLVDGGPAEFAGAVSGLLHDHERRIAMGRSGAALVKAKFSVAAMGRRYLDFFRNLLD